MKQFTYLICTIITCTAFTSCAPREAAHPPETQLQIREMQTREFDTKDTKLVMKSMMHVLQDEGFIIKNAVSDLGLLSAEKNIDIEDKGQAIMVQMLVGPGGRWNKQQILDASANVSEFGDKTRVRINFQIKTLDNFGSPADVITIKDPKKYQEFFDKVSKGVFIQSQNI